MDRIPSRGEMRSARETADEVTRTARGGKAQGRKDAQKQEKVIDLKVLKDRASELIKLIKKAKAASVELSEAVKKAAEESGLNSSAVRRYFGARAGDSFAEAKRNAEQLALLFDELKG